MFDIAYSELLLVAVVALVVIGPKDLPRALRVVGGWVGRGRSMARHMRAGFDEMMRQAEIDEMEEQWRRHNAAIMAGNGVAAAAATPPSLSSVPAATPPSPSSVPASVPGLPPAAPPAAGPQTSPLP